ncbi:hypothetical protein D3C78_1423030 [compost metagenome]
MVHLLRRGAGGHVEILGRDSQQQVPHRATDDIGGETGVLQPRYHTQGGMAECVTAHAVLGQGKHTRLALVAGQAGRQVEDSTDEFTDHRGYTEKEKKDTKSAFRRRIIARFAKLAPPACQYRRRQPRAAAA